MTLPTAYDPATEYQRRLAERQAGLAKLKRLDDGIATARGLMFLGAVVFCIFWYFDRALPAWPFGLLLVAFVGLVVVHPADWDCQDGMVKNGHTRNTPASERMTSSTVACSPLEGSRE